MSVVRIAVRGFVVSALSFLLGGCSGAALAPSSRAPSSDLARSVLRGMPRGADACVFTAPHLVSDRRRALLAETSEADALGWARTPHVAAYARCRYRGAREAVVWRLSIDGELDRDALPMHVQWEGEGCEAEACDLPVAHWDGEVLELRSPTAVRERSDRGAEGDLAALVSREGRILEARVSEREVAYFVLVEDGVREVRRDEARHERVLAWQEIEVLAADRRLRREHALDAGADRFVAADAIAWSDGDAIAAQLELRLDRVRRRSTRRERALEELIAFAVRALAERAEDGRVFELSLSAFVEAGRIDEALSLVDEAVVENDHSTERQVWVRGLGWELAVRADHPSAPARLVAAGLARDEEDGRSLAPLLSEALARDVGGLTRAHVEEEVRRMRELAVSASLTRLDPFVTLQPLGLLPALVALISEDSEPLELYGALDVEGVPAATVAVMRDGTRLAILPGRGLHAACEQGAPDVEALLDAAAEALRSPGDGPFSIELRVGPHDAPTRVVRLAGTVRRGRLSLEAVSPAAARWDWARIGRHLVRPFADAAELRFPEPELRWEGETVERLEQVASELELMRLAECSVEGRVLTCTPRSGRHREAILGAARALEVLPIE